MGVHVVIPVRVRVGADALDDPDAVASAVAAATGRALDRAGSELSKHAPGGPVVVHSPAVRVRSGTGKDGGSLLRAQVGDAIGREARRRVGDPVPGRRGPGQAQGWWEVVAETRIQVPLRYLIALLDATGDEPTDLADVFADRLDAVWQATAVLVEARVAFRFSDLGESVGAVPVRRVRPGQETHWAYTTRDDDLTAIAAADDTGSLRSLPAMNERNRGRVFGRGAEAVAAGGCLVTFVTFILRSSQPEEIAFFGEERSWRLPLRQVAERISAESFHRLFGVSLDAFVAEYGDRPVELRALPVSALNRPLRYETLRALASRVSLANVGRRAASFGDLHLLTRPVLAGLPPEASADLRDLARWTVDLDPAAETGTWRPDWFGAYLHVVVEPAPEELEAAELLPQARRWADQLLVFMRRNPTELAWPYQLETWLLHTFGSGRDLEGPHLGATLLFDQILRRDPQALDRLLTMIEEAGNGELHHLVLRLLAHTPHAEDTRVRESVRHHEIASHRYDRHTYDVAGNRILLDHDPDAALRPYMVIADVEPSYSVVRTVHELRPDKQAEVDKALHAASQDLLGRIASGTDATDYAEDAFVRKVLDDVQHRVEISENDIVEHEVEASLRLLGFTSAVQEGVTRFRITYELVERIDGGHWEPIRKTRTTVDQAEFEEMLWGWRYRKSAALTVLIGQIVAIAAVAVITIAVGAGALLAAAGGWDSIALSIGISEALYLLTHKHYKAGGFATAAVEGFIFAIGFGVGRIVRPALAGRIATSTITRAVFAAVVRQAASGAAGGALSALMIRFHQDVAAITLGQRREFSSPGQYIRAMPCGALFGVAAEVTLGAGGVALRGALGPELRSLNEVIARARAAGLDRAAWRKLLTEAGPAMEKTLQYLNETAVSEAMAAFRGRLAEAGDAFLAVPLEGAALPHGPVRMEEAALRAGAELTAAGREGLRRLAVGEAGMAEALAMVNRLAATPGVLGPVLEALARAEPGLLTRAGPGLRRLAESAPLETAALARQNLLLPVALSERGVALAVTTEGRASLLGYLRRSAGDPREAIDSLDLYVLAEPGIGDAELRAVLDRGTRQTLDIERAIREELEGFESAAGAEPLAAGEPTVPGGAARPQGFRAVLESVQITPAEVDRYADAYQRYVRRYGTARKLRSLEDYARFQHGIETGQFNPADLRAASTWPEFNAALDRVPLESIPAADRARLAAEYQRQLAGEWRGEPYRMLSEDQWVRWQYGRERGRIRADEGPPPGLGEAGRVERLTGYDLQRWVDRQLPAGSANARGYRAFGAEQPRRPDHLPPGSGTRYLDSAAVSTIPPARGGSRSLPSSSATRSTARGWSPPTTRRGRSPSSHGAPTRGP